MNLPQHAIGQAGNNGDAQPSGAHQVCRATNALPRRRILAIAFHFPPIQASSGVHRLLAFSRYLPSHGWDSTVLTAHSRAYGETRLENLSLIPEGTRVLRAPAWDTQRHLAVGGRYLHALALPDRWQSWIIPAFLVGLRAIRQGAYSALLSTFPIASAHVVGLMLHRATGIPWLADFRDPMVQDDYPTDARTYRIWARIERATFRHAQRITVTTPRTAGYYQQRYRDVAEKVRVIPNGFDPEVFPDLGERPEPVPPGKGMLTLLHSGVMYPSERDPVPFFRALARLVHSGDPAFSELRVVLRDSRHDELYQKVVGELSLTNHVQLLPALPYREAVAEMLTADGLLVFQSKDCNSQIPAKVYEYLYAGKPLVGVVDPAGDTGALLLDMNVPVLAPLEDDAAIESMLREVVPRIRAGTYPRPARSRVDGLSRKARTAEMGAILDEMVAEATMDGTPRCTGTVA